MIKCKTAGLLNKATIVYMTQTALIYIQLNRLQIIKETTNNMRQTKALFLVLVALAFTMSASAQSLDSLKTICYEALESDDTATFNRTYPMLYEAFTRENDEYYEVRQTLAKIRNTDQSIRILVADIHRNMAGRGKYLSLVRPVMNAIDRANVEIVTNFIDKHGWLGKDDIGEDGNETLFLCIQHCQDSVIQHKYLPIIEDAVKKGNAEPWHFAFLTDRVLMNQGKPQIYGTQTIAAKGRTFLVPLQNTREVDALRKSIGLESLDNYMQGFGEHFSVADYLKEEASINAIFKHWLLNRK